MRYAPPFDGPTRAHSGFVWQTASLSKHLVFLRHTFDIGLASSPPPSPPPPKARRPVGNSVASPKIPRLSRPPTIPGIFEENECSSGDEYPKNEPVNLKTASPSRRKIRTKPRLSASRLPLPARGSPPLVNQPPSPTGPQINMEVALSNGAGLKKLPRRQSGLLSVNLAPLMQRPPSPAFGSPVLVNVAQDDDGETTDAKSVDANGRPDDVDYAEPEEKVVRRDKRKGKAREREQDKEEESLIDVARPRDRDRKRPRDEEFCPSTAVAESKMKFKDVTNSPRPPLSPLDTGVTGACRRGFICFPAPHSHVHIL
jgi:hypothetical protein